MGVSLRWLQETLSRRAGNNEAQRARVENTGVLIASGLIAGEALTGLLIGGFKAADKPIHHFFADPSYGLGFLVFAAIGAILVRLPLTRAGRPEDPAPPAVMM
jgi:hypothetical protein